MRTTLKFEANEGDGELHGLIEVDGRLIASLGSADIIAGTLYAMRVRRYTLATRRGSPKLDVGRREASENALNNLGLDEATWRLAADSYFTLRDLHFSKSDPWKRPILDQVRAEVADMPPQDAARFKFPPGIKPPR